MYPIRAWDESVSSTVIWIIPLDQIHLIDDHIKISKSKSNHPFKPIQDGRCTWVDGRNSPTSVDRFKHTKEHLIDDHPNRFPLFILFISLMINVDDVTHQMTWIMSNSISMINPSISSTLQTLIKIVHKLDWTLTEWILNSNIILPSPRPSRELAQWNWSRIHFLQKVFMFLVNS